MNLVGSLLKLILGSNMQGSSVRVTYAVLLGAGWILGDRYGVPVAAEGLVDQLLLAAEGMLGNVLPGSESAPVAE